MRQTYRFELKHSKIQTITPSLAVKVISDERAVFDALMHFDVSRLFLHSNCLTSDTVNTLRGEASHDM